MAVYESTSDYKLVDKLQKGNVDAFDQIFKKYGDRLFGFVFKYLKSKEETEELVQDVFLKIWENRKNIKKEFSFKSYLFTIAYHEICAIFKQKHIQVKIKEDFLLNKNQAVNLEEQLEYKSVLEFVDKLIEKLPEKQKIIFIKSRKQGKTTREIAKEMNLAPGTVDNQISMALKFLRENLPNNNLLFILFFAIFIK